jgi:hypothetical protein
MLRQMNTVHVLTSSFFWIHFYVILPFTPSFPKWSSTIRFSRILYVFISHAWCMPHRSQLLNVITLITYDDGYTVWRALLFIFFLPLLRLSFIYEVPRPSWRSSFRPQHCRIVVSSSSSSSSSNGGCGGGSYKMDDQVAMRYLCFSRYCSCCLCRKEICVVDVVSMY